MATTNFLSQFQNDHPHHIVDFMKIWYHYDTNRNGYLDTSELFNFVKDYVQLGKVGKDTSDEMIKQDLEHVITLYDKNKDGKIELNELQAIVPKEKNFLTQFQEGLTEAEFEQIFRHYDKDGNGLIENAELIALLKDLREIGEGEGEQPSLTTDLEEYRDQIIEMADIDHDGILQKRELRILFLGR